MVIDVRELYKGRGVSFMPDAKRRTEIEEIVNGILVEHDIGEPGFDLTQFLINKEQFQIGSQFMNDDTTGFLLVDDNTCIPGTDVHKLVMINEALKRQDDFIRRKRFIIAHEYAHYKLHKKNDVQYAHRDTSKKDTPEEREADFFARCLLMPQKAIQELATLEMYKAMTDLQKIDFISNAFKVTAKKAKLRLFELGYIL